MCASVASWRTEVETIATDAAKAVTEPGATRATLEAAIDEGLDATETLVDDLRAAVPPDTPEGDEAKAAVDAFLDNVQASDDEVRSALAGLPEGAGLAEVIAELSGLATNLQTTIASGQALVTELTELGGSLKDAFENADSCQELQRAGVSTPRPTWRARPQSLSENTSPAWKSRDFQRLMPGEGVEPSRPRRGTPDFKSGAYRQFRHPGRGCVAPSCLRAPSG